MFLNLFLDMYLKASRKSSISITVLPFLIATSPASVHRYLISAPVNPAVISANLLTLML